MSVSIFLLKRIIFLYFIPQLGGYAFIGEGIPIGLGAAFQSKYRKVSSYKH